jgi:hypothetical protein
VSSRGAMTSCVVQLFSSRLFGGRHFSFLAFCDFDFADLLFA